MGQRHGHALGRQPPRDGATAALALFELDLKVPDAKVLAGLAALPPMREARVLKL